MSTNSKIVMAYQSRTPSSAELAQTAAMLLPSGINHDTRYLQPYGIYVDKAIGSHKWDADGNKYVDYFGGHGALLLGHNQPEVLEAVQAALSLGTHFGTSHAIEVRWAQQVIDMLPSAQKIRFTSSGTEATHLALRLARAFSGKQKLVRVKTHFHGWHDHMTSGWLSHFDGSATAGVLSQVAASVRLLEPEDIEEMTQLLSTDDDIAAVIIEPTGSSFGRVPVSEKYLLELRKVTAARNIILIFDEVITGFRVSPGGAQAQYNITPDMTTLAKILAGGLPGGAVAGRADILDRIDFQASSEGKFEKISHPGTFNANPISAAAGYTALKIIAEGDACERANSYATQLRGAMNAVLRELSVPWVVYGTFSVFHIFTNPQDRSLSSSGFDPFSIPYEELTKTKPSLVQKIQLGMLLHGVHFSSWPGGVTSAVHSQDDLDLTIAAFRETLLMLKDEAEIS